VRTIVRRLAPGGGLLILAVALLQSGPGREWLAALVPGYAYAVFGAGLLLAWRFNQGRLAFALFVLLAADRALAHVATGALGPSGRVVAGAIAVLLPVDLALLAWLPERGRLTPRAGSLLVAIALQPLGVALIARPEASAAAHLLEPHALGGGALVLSTPALVAFGAALASAAVRGAGRHGVVEAGELCAGAAAFLGVTAGTPLAASVYFATGGLTLLIALVETSHRLAFADELTGLPSRRALNDALLTLGDEYAIAMVDIDHFKKFNDAHGHAAGDQLLRMIGTRLARVPGGGRAFRYGGEEFAVLFPGCTVDEVRPHLEEFRRGLEATGFTLRGHDRPRRKPATPRSGGARTTVSVTVSVGVAQPNGDRASAGDVLRAADRALYRAKRGGRNRICT
jgi:diguanylate cyclase (GGDEF)-like protein